MRPRHSKKFIEQYKGRLILALVIVSAGLYLSFSSPVYFGDSPQYLAAAKGLVSYGRLLNVNANPMVHWAPLTSFIYVPVYAFQIPLDIWARFVNISALSIFSLTSFLIVRHVIRNELWAGMVASFLTIWMPALYQYAAVQSEPIFMALIVVSAYAFLRLTQQWSWQQYVVLLIAGALIVATRFSGIFFIGAVALTALIYLRYSWVKRLMLAAVYGAFSLLPFGAWSLRTYLLYGILTDREVNFQTIVLGDLLEQFDHIVEALTGTYSYIIGSLIALLMIILFMRLRRHHWGVVPQHAQNVFPLFFVWAGTYIASIALTYFLYDRAGEVTYRLIMPAIYFYYLIAVVAVFHLWQVFYGAQKKLVFILLVFLLIEGLATSFGLYYQTKMYQLERASLQSLQNFDWYGMGSTLYTNADEVFFYLTGDYVAHTPYRRHRAHWTSNPSYQEEMREMVDAIRDGGSIVYFKDTLYQKYYQLPIEDLIIRRDLQMYFENDDVAFFSYKKEE